jgi:poly(3-hydroxybutyrate) depolymerase
MSQEKENEINQQLNSLRKALEQATADAAKLIVPVHESQRADAEDCMKMNCIAAHLSDLRDDVGYLIRKLTHTTAEVSVK